MKQQLPKEETQPADWSPKWADRIELPKEEHKKLMLLLKEWNDEQDFIEKHSHDAFIIYGHLHRQEDIKREVLAMYEKYRHTLSHNFDIGVGRWMEVCFGDEIAADKVERNYRFFEEATELVQACGMTKEDCLRLIDYVYDRPVGEKKQEVGGVMVTLAALCLPNGIDMNNAGEAELERCWKNIDKIRQKQAAKKIKSPLP